MSSYYGVIGENYRKIYAHRLSYIIKYGKIPNEIFVLHKCDNPPCVNPKHLFLGTAKDNAIDRERKGRGYKLNNSKLSKEIAIEIRKIYTPYSGMTDKLANKYGVAKSTIYNIVNGQNWPKDS